MAIPTQGYIYINNQQIAFNVLQNFEDNGFSVDNDGYALYNDKRFYYNGTLVLGTDEPIDGEYYWTIIDLTNTTWVINSTTCTAGYGQFNINLSRENDTSYSYSAINIGYRAQLGGELIQSYANRVALTTINPAYDFDNYKELLANDVISITGGTDATNSNLIAWLEANAVQQVTPSGGNIHFGNLDITNMYFGNNQVSKIYYGNTLIYEVSGDIPDNAILDANGNYLVDTTGGYLLTTEVSLISFVIVNNQVIPATTNTYYAEQGMTWVEWCNSQYNTIGLYCDEAFDVVNSTGHLYDDDPPTSYVEQQNVIIANYQYYLQTGGGSND